MNPKDLKKLMKDVGFESIETRNSDSLDFQDTAVWSVRSALEAAYELGRKAGLKEGGGWVKPGR